MKLHNNPLAHQNTPGDYLVDYEMSNYLRLHLVECKQVTCDENGKGRLTFKRLKQMHDLITFAEIRRSHYSWFCVAFKEKFWSQSDVYLIPAWRMKVLVDSSNMMSINRENFRHKMPRFKTTVFHGLIDLAAIKEI